jgi:hypothetical protein
MSGEGRNVFKLRFGGCSRSTIRTSTRVSSQTGPARSFRWRTSSKRSSRSTQTGFTSVSGTRVRSSTQECAHAGFSGRLRLQSQSMDIFYDYSLVTTPSSGFSGRSRGRCILLPWSRSRLPFGDVGPLIESHLWEFRVLVLRPIESGP